MSDDPFTEYFTPERLKRFEELRERFPHWCLDWPSVAKIRAVVTPSHRLSLAVQEMRDDLKVWEGFPRLGDDVRCEAWMEGKTACVRVIELDYSDDEIGEGQVDVDVPAAHFALFASIAHTLSSLRSSLERDYLIREWMDQIEGILVSDPRQSEKRDKLLKLAARARHASARAAQCLVP